MAASEIRVPDLEGAENVGVVEVYVAAGDQVELETPLISLESDKAVMDVPSPVEGTITEVRLSEGDTVNAGDVIALAETREQAAGAGEETPSASTAEEKEEKGTKADKTDDEPRTETPSAAPIHTGPEPDAETETGPVNAQAPGAVVHATPSVRALARELGVDLSGVNATGPKGRITRDDVTGLVKSVMSGTPPSAGTPAGSFALPPIPGGDYAAFGDVTEEPLGRIKRISGPHLHRSWVGVPHVTHFEEADITELESFRKRMNEEGASAGEAKLSPLAFIVRAAAGTLRAFPEFNSSLNPDGTSLTRKGYINIGIAVDTPGGLMVPVLKDADAKGLREIAGEMADLSFRAREGRLKADELKGATFSISSLGGIGGTGFTPIVNAPEVAILGVSRSAMKPVWNGAEFEPRLILPFSLSYDHRVIDGAQGARFAVYLSRLITDPRRILL